MGIVIDLESALSEETAADFLNTSEQVISRLCAEGVLKRNLMGFIRLRDVAAYKARLRKRRP